MNPERTPVILELSDAELHLLTSALRSFETDFGHEQADLLHEIKNLIAKLTAARRTAG